MPLHQQRDTHGLFQHELFAEHAVTGQHVSVVARVQHFWAEREWGYLDWGANRKTHL